MMGACHHPGFRTAVQGDPSTIESPPAVPAAGSVRVEWPGGGVLVCDEPTHDFGHFWVDECPCVAHTFLIRNIGDGAAYVEVGITGFFGIGPLPAYRMDPGVQLPLTLSVKSSLCASKGPSFSVEYVLRPAPPDPSLYCPRCGHGIGLRHADECYDGEPPARSAGGSQCCFLNGE